MLRAPSTRTPSPGVDACLVHLQARGRWRAGLWWGQPGARVSVSEMDWTTTSTELVEPSSAYARVRPPGVEGRGSLVLNTSMTEAEVEAGEPYRAGVGPVWNPTRGDSCVPGAR